MKSSKKQVEQNREIILEAASELFRKRGFDGVRVAEIMQAAGLTHGGFYAYFKSKEDLIAQTCANWIKKRSEHLQSRQKSNPKLNRKNYIDNYLTEQKRDNPDIACLFPSLCGEIARQPEEVRDSFSVEMHQYFAALGDYIGAQSEKETIVTLSTLIGAQILSRAISDKELSNSIMNVVKENLKGQTPL